MPTIIVEGMTCGHCEQTVELTLTEVTGVTSVTADRETDQVTIEGDAGVTFLRQAVENAGYTAHA